MKSAYEAALERLAKQGIEPPREDLDPAVKRQMADARERAAATLAELEIMHRDRVAKLSDPTAAEQAEEEYRIDRRRVEDERDRALARLRQRL